MANRTDRLYYIWHKKAAFVYFLAKNVKKVEQIHQKATFSYYLGNPGKKSLALPISDRARLAC